MKKAQETEIQVIEVNQGVMQFCVLGEMPMIISRMTEKARQELLLPKGKKTAAEKAANAKHDPLTEYRASPYTLPNDDAPTLLAQLAVCFKKAIAGAALDMPGANKSQIGRLCWVEGERIPVYGIPNLFMAVTRSADMNRTPDVRTRCIVPKWACTVTVKFAKPLLREQIIANLLATAGMTQGVGDWRPQKGSGTYGQFRLVSADDAEFNSIVKNGGRAAQIEAMDNPEPYDMETEELLTWYGVEARRRGFTVVS